MRKIFLAVALFCPMLLFAYDAQTANREMPNQIYQDWLRQDMGNFQERVTKVLAELDARKSDTTAYRETFRKLENVSDADPRRDAFYREICQRRRVLRLENLQKTAPKIVFTKRRTFSPSFYAYTEGLSDAQAEKCFLPGSALCLLEGNEKGEWVQKNLLDGNECVFRDPVVSFDGKRIFFAWKKHSVNDDYHLYTYDVASGTVRQLTDGLGFADYEPCPLPDGNILFSSTRCIQAVDCWKTEVSNLYRCDADGKNITRIGFDQVHTNYPTLLSDGRVIYTRWDYNDRGQIYPQALFQMNMDGTAQTECYGNNSYFPTSILHAQGVPGSRKILAILSGHHTRQRGKLALIDTSVGRQEGVGIEMVSPRRPTVVTPTDMWGQFGDQFQYPIPLSETEYLVGFYTNADKSNKPPRKFGIFWMDADGRRELLAYDARVDCNQPYPLKPREEVPVRPSTVDTSLDYGTYYVQDVFFGPGLKGIDRSKAKKLRVVGLQFRDCWIGDNHNHGPAGGALVSTPISIGHGTWDVKVILGDTDIYPDGSACFKVPARTPVYFQILDKKGYCIQTMRSWSTLQPGENFACLGCHEDKNTGTTLRPGTTEAMRRGPQELQPFYGPARGFSFEKEIQPILDRHCIRCHANREKVPPYASGALAEWGKTQTPTSDAPFSLLNVLNEDKTAKRFWSDSYLNLTGAARRDRTQGVHNRAVNWLNVQEGPALLPPYKAGACQSGLLAQFEGDTPHNDVRLSPEEKQKLALWIDLLVPYCGSYTEHAAWTPDDWAKWDYYQKKKEKP
ncbi:MAG: hypothetical protein Q4D98_02515 [Planctomycetia bacterium]|nr:hypothetical protein [Planctomycetia bacterium]